MSQSRPSSGLDRSAAQANTAGHPTVQATTNNKYTNYGDMSPTVGLSQCMPWVKETLPVLKSPYEELSSMWVVNLLKVFCVTALVFSHLIGGGIRMNFKESCW